MRKITRFTLAIIVALTMTITTITPVYAERTNTFDYTWGVMGIEHTAAGFQIARVIDSSYMPIPMERVDDIAVGGGFVFIADSAMGRVNVLDAKDYSFVTSIRLVRDEDNNIVIIEETNEQLMLDGPEGVFFNTYLNRLYIADTSAYRIVVLDGSTFHLIEIITRPDDMTGNTAFRPSQLVVDNTGRIFFMVSGSFEGLVALDPDGSFARYFGTTRPHMSPVEYFWRSIATAEQRMLMPRTFAPAFSGVDIDQDGFVFAVTADSASTYKLFRFNARGDNVIRSEGNMGFIEESSRGFMGGDMSQFVAVAATDFGVYAVVDRTFGRVFVYDFDGYLITIFSQIGDTMGDLNDPSSLAWNGYDILVGDRTLGVVNVFTPTRFGAAALAANQAYHEGRWEEANYLFREAVALNATFYSAYSGIGRNLLMQRRYLEAMYYFDLAFDQEGYSRAWAGRRGELIEQYFPIIAIVVVSLAALLIITEARYLRKARYQDGEISDKKPKIKKASKSVKVKNVISEKVKEGS